MCKVTTRIQELEQKDKKLTHEYCQELRRNDTIVDVKENNNHIIIKTNYFTGKHKINKVIHNKKIISQKGTYKYNSRPGVEFNCNTIPRKHQKFLYNKYYIQTQLEYQKQLEKERIMKKTKKNKEQSKIRKIISKLNLSYLKL